MGASSSIMSCGRALPWSPMLTTSVTWSVSRLPARIDPLICRYHRQRLSGLSSTFAPRPDGQPLWGTLPGRSQIERQSLDAARARQIANQVADLIRSRGDLNTAYGRLTSSVQTIEQMQERMQIAQSQIDLIEQCRPKSVRTEPTTVPPGPFRIPSGTGTSRFIIQGGKAPYRAELPAGTSPRT